jgi:hypothetical protein
VRNPFRYGAIALSIMSSAGCVSPEVLKADSAGQTGCAPAAIQVTKPQGIVNGYMWNATCSGKKYLCTALNTGTKSSQVSCALAAQ